MKLNFSKEVFFILLSIFLFTSAIGIDLVTFPTLFTKNQFNPVQIGIIGAYEILGGILMSFFLTKIILRFGFFKSLSASIFLFAAIILITYFCHNFYLWLALSFGIGLNWFIAVIPRQSWLNTIIDNQNRSIITGIYSATVSAGIAFGPIIVKISGANSYSSFLIAALLMVLSFNVLLLINRHEINNIQLEKISLLEFLKNNPRAVLARFFLDAQCYSLLIFSVVFGKKIGFTSENSGLLITAFMMSGFFDIFVGFIMKKYSGYKLINIGFLGCLIIFSTLCLYHQSYIFLLTAYFLFGFPVACIYVAVIAITNSDYPNQKLIAANSSLQAVGSIGSLFGGLVSGVLIYEFDAVGFPIAISLFCLTYLVFLVIYEKKYQK